MGKKGWESLYDFIGDRDESGSLENPKEAALDELARVEAAIDRRANEERKEEYTK